MAEDEMVDIVNEQDVVVGTSSKAEAHKQGLLHRTVIAEVVGSDGKWTLVLQSSDRQDAGQLVSPIGGHVTAGESSDEALTREANEEYGLTGDYPYRLIGKKIFNREVRDRKENHYFVLYEIQSDEKPVLNTESVSVERFSKEELRQAMKDTPKRFGDAFYFVVNAFYPELLR
jgi:8-oxo-dGTP pyrophosphatase MutT (NUDIX family)